jgi:site-specific recombinase XerD
MVATCFAAPATPWVNRSNHRKLEAGGVQVSDTTTSIRWEFYPEVAAQPEARQWLQVWRQLQRAPNTIDAYGRGLNDYLAFLKRAGHDPLQATLEHVSLWINDMEHRPPPGGTHNLRRDSRTGLARATIHQRLTAVRLFYDFLKDTLRLRDDNPVDRGRSVHDWGSGARSRRGLLRREVRYPWVPTDEQWDALLTAAAAESLRNRLMFILAYDTGLRREELCSLRIDDVQPSQRTIRIRAETTKSGRERLVPFSADLMRLYGPYLAHRRALSPEPGPLFLSESNRNRTQPITIWTWTDVVERIARRANVPQFTPHTFRHLCLTDLARSGWRIQDIATFAGHRNTSTTLLYIHLGSGDLARKLNESAPKHRWRARSSAERLS